MARLPQEEWEALVDELFALDKDHPYIGQAIDPDTDEVLSLSFDPDQPRDDSGRWSNTGGGVGKAEARAQFQSMFQNIAKPDGGFTYSPVHGTSPTKGYALAIKGHEAVFDAKTLSFDQLDEYAVSKHDVLSGKGMHLGAWHNPEDGKVYLDVSIVVDNQEEAAKLAKEYEQIAYFDLEAGKSIQAGGRQDHRVTYGGESDDSDALGRQRGGRGPDRGGADRTVQVGHRAGAHAGRDREGGRSTAAPFGNGLSYRDKLYALAFNPDQPRDDSGRWSDGGGSSSGNDSSLPDEPSRYFTIDDKTTMVPLSALRTTRARPEGIANAEPLMRKAYHGEGQRRKPISVKSNGDGTYSVLDGNSTTAIAIRHGWAKIPAHISLAFNPDQPRDENGQWVAGSGSGGAVRGGHIATFDEHDTRTGNYLGLGKADTFIRASELTPELKKALNDSLSNPDVPVFVPAVGYTFRPLGKTPLIYKASNGVSVVKTYDAGGSFHDYRVEKEMAIPLNVAMKEPSWIAESSYDEDREEFAAENAGRHTRAEAEAALAEWADKFIVPDATARYEVKQARKGLKLHDDRRHDLAFNPDQPRDELGRFASGGGSAYARPVPIRVEHVDEAVKLILDGKVVEMPDTRSVNTLLVRLADMAKRAKAEGKDAPRFDLCQVSVPRTNLFCADKLRTDKYPDGVPRIEMPQLAGTPVAGSKADSLPRNEHGRVDGAAAFVEHLKSLGISSETRDIPAAKLKASQSELIGSTVAGMMASSFDPSASPIFVSRDHYVVDGHHRWAAVVGRDAEDGKLGDLRMHTVMIDAPISEVLLIANTWAAEYGFPQKSGVKKLSAYLKALHVFTHAEAEDRRLLLAFNPDQPRDDHGRWAASDDVPGLSDAVEKIKKSGGTFSVPEILGYVDAEFRNTLNTIKKKIPEARAALNDVATSVASKFGGVFVPSVDDVTEGVGVKISPIDIKGEKRIVEKALIEYDGDLDRVADVVRTTIAVDDIGQVKDVVDAIKSESQVDRVKNRMANPNEAGYRDALVNVILPNGMRGEIQVHVKPMLRAKNGDGHAMYKQMRSTTDSAEIASLTRRSQELYGNAWNESIKRTTREISEALNFNDHLPRSGRSALPRSIGRPETHAAVERQARTVGGLRRGLGDGALGRPARVGAVADRRAAGVMHFPTVSDVSFPAMIGAVPSAPKNRRKRRPVQYRGVTLGRKPNDLESRVLSLSEIPKRFDADMGFAVDALTKIRMRQAKSMSTDHRAEIVRVLSEVQDGMRRYGAFEMRQECARQGLRLSVNTERHDCYSLSADAVDAIGDAMSDRVQLAADQIQAEWRAHLSGLSATAKRTGRSLASLSAQAEARVSSGLRTAVRPMLTEAFALGRRYEMKRIAAKARRRTDVITLRTVDEDDLERLVDYVIQTAVMDTSTCEPCAEADGLVFEYGDDDMLLYEPPFYQCLGGGNCRCSQIYVLKDGSTWDVSEA